MLLKGGSVIISRELGDINEMLGSGVFHELSLAAVINANYTQSHALAGKLHGDMAETAAGTGNNDELARLRIAAL
jgi:hypothetical protein